jgi:hypothetical protein
MTTLKLTLLLALFFVGVFGATGAIACALDCAGILSPRSPDWLAARVRLVILVAFLALAALSALGIRATIKL